MSEKDESLRKENAIVEIDGKEYELELDRKIFATAERVGFKMDLLLRAPAEQCEIIWLFAIKKHNPNLSDSLAIKLLDKYVDEHGIADLVIWVGKQYEVFLQTTQSDSEKKGLRTVPK